MSEDQKACRASSPDSEPCMRPRGHKTSPWGRNGHHRDPQGREFDGGVRTPAYWFRADDGYMSEADYQTWGRL